ncbi:MAG: hypothetical protein ACFBSC_15345 [Microcoleaceae cyanobacterium]
MRHTPKPIVDMAHAVPELASFARETVRLHPRQGESANDASKIGGDFIWPAKEPWPRCEEHNCPYIPILQLRRDDVPELEFYQETDLFQILWCPNDHKTVEPLYAPSSKVFWRRRSDIHEILASMPKVDADHRGYVPAPCVLHPEQVIEYPSAFALTEDFPHLWEKIEAADLLKQAIETTKESRFGDLAPSINTGSV